MPFCFPDVVVKCASVVCIERKYGLERHAVGECLVEAREAVRDPLAVATQIHTCGAVLALDQVDTDATGTRLDHMLYAAAIGTMGLEGSPTVEKGGGAPLVGMFFQHFGQRRTVEGADRRVGVGALIGHAHLEFPAFDRDEEVGGSRMRHHAPKRLVL